MPVPTKGPVTTAKGVTNAPVTTAKVTTKAPTTTPKPTTTKAPTTTARPTTKPTTVPAAPTIQAGELAGTEPLGNTLAEFKLRKPPSCPARLPASTTTQCGGYDYEQALCMSMYFFAAQAGGKSSIDWRGDCFTEDGLSDGKNLTLGWFDAGDYVKFGLPMAYSAMGLAWGALEFPAGYRAGGQQLRSLLYNLRVFAFYILEGWDPATQRLVAQIGTGGPDHSSWLSCKKRRSEARKVYYISPTCRGTEVAADTASALASIALVLKTEEGASSAALQTKLATAALQIYNFANNYRGSYTSCVTDAANFYNSVSGYTDELALAATWMASLKSAGLISSNVDFVAAAKSLYNYPWFISWDNKWLAVSLRLAQLTNIQSYKNDVKNQIDQTIGGSKTPGGLWNVQEWGNLRYNGNEAFAIRLANKLGIVSDSYNTHAKRVIDYMLGSNPARRSLVVGFGNNPPVQAHHRSAHDGTSITSPTANTNILFGALVGGPYNSDTYYDDRTNYIVTEVATDYNALYTGALASLVGQNCAMKTTPTTTTTTAAPRPGTSAYAVAVVAIDPYWLQVTINPIPNSAVAVITTRAGATYTYSLEGPKWGSHFTFGPNTVISSTDRVAIIVKPTASSTSGQRLQYIVREGSLSMSALRSSNTEVFAEEIFVSNVATALNIEENRITVDSVDVTSGSVQFSVLPMPSAYYTPSGQELCVKGSAGLCTFMPNTHIESQLVDATSKLSIALSAAIGSAAPVSIVRSASEGPGADSVDESFFSKGANQAAFGSGMAVAAILLGAAVVAAGVMYRRRAAKMRRQAHESDIRGEDNLVTPSASDVEVVE